MSSRTGRDLRSYYRVETELAVRVRRATASELATFEQCFGAGGTEPSVALAPGLVTWLRYLDQKLDRVLALLDPSQPRPLEDHGLQHVVISGGGMLVEQTDGLEPGADVIVELVIPGEPPHRVRALGRVVGLRQREGAPGVGLEFRLIDESDRDAIVRMVNRIQLATRLRDAERRR